MKTMLEILRSICFTLGALSIFYSIGNPTIGAPDGIIFLFLGAMLTMCGVAITEYFDAREKKYSDRGKLHFGNIQMPLMVVVALGVYRDTVIGRWIFAYSYITIPLIV